MKVIFLSIGGFSSITAHDQYPDLLREFQKHGHDVFVVCANEKRYGMTTECVDDNGVKILRVRIGNITQSGLIEKGIATVLVGKQYKKAIDKHFRDIKFDLVLYTTPPITLVNVIQHIKRKCNAKTYLILKDIFPQNAVDIGLMSTKGIRSILYKYFRNQEKKLYGISDKIGTMSEANTNYLVNHNPEIGNDKVQECPNCLEVRAFDVTSEEKRKLREKYQIPTDKTVFVYGGNLGKPQDIPFVLMCIKACRNIDNAFFWIIGNGTEYKTIESFIQLEKPVNLKLSKRLPKDEYDRLIASCDIGLIFLDHRFTIPNFPSRMLAYMQAGLPILACTDSNTDIGKTIVNGGYGWWCESDKVQNFADLVQSISNSNYSSQKNAASLRIYDYTAEKSYKIIMGTVTGNRFLESEIYRG